MLDGVERRDKGLPRKASEEDFPSSTLIKGGSWRRRERELIEGYLNKQIHTFPCCCFLFGRLYLIHLVLAFLYFPSFSSVHFLFFVCGLTCPPNANCVSVALDRRELAPFFGVFQVEAIFRCLSYLRRKYPLPPKRRSKQEGKGERGRVE